MATSQSEDVFYGSHGMYNIYTLDMNEHIARE